MMVNKPLNTVDGRNSAPSEMYKSLVNHGMNYQPQLVSRISSINSQALLFPIILHP